jgi:hypothetical protein
VNWHAVLARNLGSRGPAYLRDLVAQREAELRQQGATWELEAVADAKANAASYHDLMYGLPPEQRAVLLTEDPRQRNALRYQLENNQGRVQWDAIPASTVTAPPPTNWSEAPARARHAEVRRLYELELPPPIIAREMGLSTAYVWGLLPGETGRSPLQRVWDAVPGHADLPTPLALWEQIVEDTEVTKPP